MMGVICRSTYGEAYLALPGKSSMMNRTAVNQGAGTHRRLQTC